MAPPSYLFDPDAFIAALSGRGPLIGLDPGTKTLGVAISDLDWTLSSPVETIQRTTLAQDAAKLSQLIEKEAVVGIVIGMPLQTDGTAGPRAQSVRAFRRELAKFVELPMLFWDERYSTAAAQDLLVESPAKRESRQAMLDAAAAAIILGDALPTLVSLRGSLKSA